MLNRQIVIAGCIALASAACGESGGDTPGAAGAASGGAGGERSHSGGASAGGGAGASGAGGLAGAGGSGGATVDPSCTPSALYGKHGELWRADGRLREVAWAGYRTGNVPLPRPTSPSLSVADFGATPDDDTDDTQAFLDAIAAAPSGVVSIPKGNFIITERLELKKPDLVLRGAGAGATVLSFPKSLGDVYGLTFNSAGQSSWSFTGGFIHVSGSDSGAKLADVTAAAKLGDKHLALSTVSGLSAGMWVRLLMTDDGGGLLEALHAGYFPGNVAEDGGKQVSRFYSKIESVDSTGVVLERPLPLRVELAWKPELRAVAPKVREVGLEGFTMEFAGTPYPGHFKERGYNAIYLTNVVDSWVRDVTILNADYGVGVSECHFVTVTDVNLDTTFDRGPLVGHHGLSSTASGDLLFTRFDVRKTFIHDLTVDGYARGTVWSDGRGVDLAMDHHGRAPNGSLFTNLDLGAGTRPFKSGGSTNRLPHSGAYSTFWNVRAARSLALPPDDYGPLLTFVAVATGATSVSSPYDWSLESVDGAKLCQPDLHAAMVRDLR